MKTWVRRTARVGILSAGFLLLAGTAATAANATPAVHSASAEADGANSGQVSRGNQGLVNGTQVAIPIQVPVNVCGNGIGIVGVGVGVNGNCDDGAADVTGASSSTESAHVTEDGANDGQVSSDNQGILNGTQVYAPIQVPVNVCGNGIGIVGVGIGVNGNCDDGAANVSGARSSDNDHHGDHHGDRRGHRESAEAAHLTEEGQTSDNNDGILNGTQAAIPIQVPVNVCGNGIGIIGVGIGVNGNCDNGALVASSSSSSSGDSDDGDHHDGDHHGHDGGDYRDGGDHSNAVKPAKAAKKTTKEDFRTEAAESGMFGGNDDTNAADDGDGANSGQISDDNQGILNGTQLAIPIQVPVNVCGNGIGIVGVGVGVNGNCSNGALVGNGSSSRDDD
jgi:hypothetical protein